MGVTELSDAQKKQLKEQQEVSLGAEPAGSRGAGGVLSPTSSHSSLVMSYAFGASPCWVDPTVRGKVLGQQAPVSSIPPPKGASQPALDPELRPSHTGQPLSLMLCSYSSRRLWADYLTR